MSVAMTHLPAPKEVKDLLTGLLDKEISLRPGPPFAVSPLYPASIASFVDDSLVVRAVVAFDLPLSAFLGSALALVPPAQAQIAIEETKLAPAMAEAVHEVFNIVGSLFNVGDSPHLRLYQATPAGEPLAADARSRTQILGRREDLVVEITGYGTGRIAIVLC